MPTSAGTAVLDVIPGLDGFRQRLQRDLDAQLRRATGQVRVDPDTRGFGSSLTRGTHGPISGLAGHITDTLGQAFKRVAQVGALALGAAGVGILKVGMEYQDSMNIFQSVSRSSAAVMEEVRQKAKALGADMSLPATSAADAAAAMTELVKAGLSVNDTMAAAKGVLQLASAAQVDEARAAQITANALNAFGLSGSEAGRVADLLAAAANSSSGEITDMADALQQSSAVFAMSKVSVDDLTTSIALMANKGIIGSDAGTSLKAMLLQLQTPTKKAKTLMEELGLNVYDASGRMRPFRDLIDEFTKKLGPLNQEQRDFALGTIFGSDAIRSSSIVMLGGVKAFDEMRTAVTRQGAAADVAAAKTKGLRGAWEGLKSQLETVAIDIFERVSPGLERFVRGIAERVPGVFAELSGGMRAFASAFRAADGDITSSGFPGFMERLGFIARQVVDWFRANWPQIRETVSTVMAAVIAAIGAVVAWVQANWPKISEVFRSVVETVGAYVAMMRAQIEAAVAVISDLWDRFGQNLLQHWQTAFNAVVQTLSGVLEVIKGIFNVFAGIFTGDWSRVWEGIRQIFGGVWDAIVGLLRQALNAVSTAIGATMATISAAWSVAWHGIHTLVMDVWEGIKSAVLAGVRFIVDRFLDGVAVILGGAERMFSWVPGVGGKLTEARRGFDRFRDEVNASLGGIQDKRVGVQVEIGTGNVAGATTFGPALGPRAKGGLIPGIGNTDSVPSLLMPGEFVIRKSAVEAIGVDNLYALNAMRFAEGGLVGLASHMPNIAATMRTVNDIVDKKAKDLAVAWVKAHPEAWPKPEGPPSGAGGGAPGPGAGRGGLTAEATRLLDAVLARFPGQRFTSGYRSPAQNAAVGGAPNSDHMYGRAIDIAPGSDAVAAFGRAWPTIKQVLWQVAGHYDHTHLATQFGEGGYVTEGLARGIEQGTQKVRDVLTKLSDIVKETVRSALQIHSPSEVFRQYGNELILGLVDGLREKFPQLQGVLNDLLAMISAARPQGPGNISASGGYRWMENGPNGSGYYTDAQLAAFSEAQGHGPTNISASGGYRWVPNGPLGPGYYTDAELGTTRPKAGLIQPAQWEMDLFRARSGGLHGVVVDEDTVEGRVLVQDYEGDWVNPGNRDRRVGPNDHGEKWWTISPEWIARHTAQTFHRGGIAGQDALLPLVRRDEMVLDPELSRFVQEAADAASGGMFRMHPDDIRSLANALRENPPVVTVDAINRGRSRARVSHS